MLEKYAQEDKLEQMNAQKRRMRQLEHKRAIEKLIEERRAQRDQERKEVINEYALQQELEKYKRDIIEQERQALLREHARNLVGFLPKV